MKDPQEASEKLVKYALEKFSTDNLSVMVVRFDKDNVKTLQDQSSIGVEGDAITSTGGISEAEKIVEDAKDKAGKAGAGSSASTGPPTIPEEPTAEEEAPPVTLKTDALKEAQKQKGA
jgi:protein phosphatase PTC1